MRPILPLFALCLTLGSASAIEVGGLTFTEGESWKPKKAARPMSRGGLMIAPGGEAKELSADFYFFGEGQGGSVEANIARWKGQFEAGATSSTEEIALNGLEGKKATIVHIKGTFLSGPPFGGKKTPIPNHAMLGAIIPGAKAPIFIKLTGAEASVESIMAKFKELAASASLKD